MGAQKSDQGWSVTLQIVERGIVELKINDQNPRRHSLKQVKQIARSIASFGFNVPILIDQDDRVLAGHGRLLAAQELGLSQLPTIQLRHLTDAQARAFIIADNRLTETSEWDDRLLAQQLQELSMLDLDFSIEATGFDTPEIDFRIGCLSEDDGADADDDIPLPLGETPITKLGDLWLLGQHRLLCADALVAASYRTLMEDRKAAAVFTDPPYNVKIRGNVSGLGQVQHREFAMASGELNEMQFIKFLATAFEHLVRSSVEGSIHYVCMDWRHMAEILAAGEIAYDELKNLCVWAKKNSGMGSFYRSQHELVFVFKHGLASHRNNVELGKHGRNRTNVWQYASPAAFGKVEKEGKLLALHPTVKPVALISDAILDCTARHDIVLDPFVGSGSTIIAADRVGRRCYAMELDPLYVDTVVRRWQKYSGTRAVLQSVPQNFDFQSARVEAENGR